MSEYTSAEELAKIAETFSDNPPRWVKKRREIQRRQQNDND